MILTKKYLQKLIAKGEAKYTNGTEKDSIVNHDNKQYVSVDRLDKQRVDHYKHN